MIVSNEVFVEQRHIDAARLLSKNGMIAAVHDPVALALNEQTDHRWFVGGDFAMQMVSYIDVNTKIQRIQLEQKVVQWLFCFEEDNDTVKPFSFIFSYDDELDALREVEAKMKSGELV